MLRIGSKVYKSIGIYEQVKRVLHFKIVYMKNSTFEDVKRVTDAVKKIYGEDVYAQLAQKRIYDYLDKYNDEIEAMY